MFKTEKNLKAPTRTSQRAIDIRIEIQNGKPFLVLRRTITNGPENIVDADLTVALIIDRDTTTETETGTAINDFVATWLSKSKMISER